MKKEPNITEHQAREIVEKMGRREPYTSKSIDDFYRSIGLEPEEPEQPGKTVTEEAEIHMTDEPSGVATGEAAQQQTAQAVFGGVPHHLSQSSQNYQPQARVRQ